VEIRQQLALLQAEIQSMQPPQATTTAPSQTPPANQSLTNNMPSTLAPATSIPTVQTSATRRTMDPKSPLSEGIQTSPWPVTYKPITLPKYNGKTDPHQFIMSFVIAAEGDALAWYSMLKPSKIYSWENLRDKILANFKGFSNESLTSTDLFQCKQNQGKH
jgi:hypothetical protein